MKTIIDYILESKGMDVMSRGSDSKARQSRPRKSSNYGQTLYTSDDLKNNKSKLNSIMWKKFDVSVSNKLKTFINSLDSFSKTKCLADTNINNDDLINPIKDNHEVKMNEYKSIPINTNSCTNGYKNYMKDPCHSTIQWNIAIDDKTVFNKIKSAFTNSLAKGIYTYDIKSYDDFYYHKNNDFITRIINITYNRILVKLNKYQFMQPCSVGINDNEKIITITILSYSSLNNLIRCSFENDDYNDLIHDIIKKYSTINSKSTYTDDNNKFDYLAVEKHWFEDIWESMFKNLKTVNDIVKQYKDNIKFIMPDEYDEIRHEHTEISKEKVLDIITKNKGKKIFMRTGWSWKDNKEYEISDMDEINKILDWAAASNVDIKTDGIHINSFSNNDLE